MSPFPTRIPDWHDEALARIEALEGLAMELRNALRQFTEPFDFSDFEFELMRETARAALAKANKELGD